MRLARVASEPRRNDERRARADEPRPSEPRPNEPRPNEPNERATSCVAPVGAPPPLAIECILHAIACLQSETAPAVRRRS